MDPYVTPSLAAIYRFTGWRVREDTLGRCCSLALWLERHVYTARPQRISLQYFKTLFDLIEIEDEVVFVRAALAPFLWAPPPPRPPPPTRIDLHPGIDIYDFIDLNDELCPGLLRSECSAGHLFLLQPFLPRQKLVPAARTLQI
jgi:hypothetical protein